MVITKIDIGIANLGNDIIIGSSRFKTKVVIKLYCGILRFEVTKFSNKIMMNGVITIKNIFFM